MRTSVFSGYLTRPTLMMLLTLPMFLTDGLNFLRFPMSSAWRSFGPCPSRSTRAASFPGALPGMAGGTGGTAGPVGLLGLSTLVGPIGTAGLSSFIEFSILYLSVIKNLLAKRRLYVFHPR